MEGCSVCGSASYIKGFEDDFGERVCAMCKRKDGEFSLITKSMAKSQYLVTESALATMKFITQPNPTNAKFRDMRLYLVKHVKTAALRRWGSMSAIEEEVRKRETAKLNRSAIANRKRVKAKKAPSLAELVAAAGSGRGRKSDDGIDDDGVRLDDIGDGVEEGDGVGERLGEERERVIEATPLERLADAFGIDISTSTSTTTSSSPHVIASVSPSKLPRSKFAPEVVGSKRRRKIGIGEDGGRKTSRIDTTVAEEMEEL